MSRSMPYSPKVRAHTLNDMFTRSISLLTISGYLPKS